MTPTILLVEEDPDDASQVGAALDTEIGDGIIWVTTFVDALTELDARPVDCVVLDLGPPHGEGPEGVDTLLGVKPAVPIVVLTGPDDVPLAIQAVRRGAQDYVLKSELTLTIGKAVTDAIERAGNQAEPAQSEALFRTVLESLSDGMIVLSANGRTQFANPQAARILGLSIDEMLGRVWTDPRWRAVDEQDHPIPQDSHPEKVVSRTGEPVVDFTMGVHLPARDILWLNVSAFPMKKGADTPPYPVVVSIRDFTEQCAAISRTQLQAGLPDAAGQAISATDAMGTITCWNPGAEQMYGWPARDALGRNMVDVMLSSETGKGSEHILAELGAGRSWTEETVERRCDGTSFPAVISLTPVLDEQGQLTATIGVTTDISEGNQVEQAMRRLTAIAESSGDAIIGKALDGTIISWDRGAENLYGYCADEVIGHPMAMLVPEESKEELEDLLRRVALGETIERFETTHQCKDGGLIDVSLTVSPVHSNDGTVIGSSAIARDVTTRAKAQRALRYQAMHDALTGLPNRVLLEDRLNRALARAQRHDQRVAVLFLDLDDFKLVNDGLGHLVGDELLIKAARRLAGWIRPDDTVARFGGDEFVIVCEVASTEAAKQVGDRLLNALQPPIEVRGKNMFVTTSIGLVVAGPDAKPDELLQQADTAMYRAKERGGARMELFDDELRDRAASRLQSATDLRRALEHGELRVFYQPIIALDNRRPLTLEALLRWQHPKRGLVLPDEFIPLAEDTGMIVPIGRWVLRQALNERALWQTHLPEQAPPRLSVNLSARQLSEARLVDDISATLRARRIDPGSLILEVTESVLTQDPGSLLTLNAIHDLGVALHVDNFGTGYSNLAYLKTLPVDALKIDRTFVDGLGTDPDDQAIVTAVIALARALTLDVVAEGVQTHQQLKMLQKLRCDFVQGFLISRPMPYAELLVWLRTIGRPGPRRWLRHRGAIPTRYEATSPGWPGLDPWAKAR